MSRSLAAALLWASFGSGCAHTVVIDSEPSGAEIRVDGKPLGAGPVTWNEQTGWEKSYDIEAHKPGFQATRRKIRQTEWHTSMTATTALCTGLFVICTSGYGAAVPVPLIGIFWARQLPDRVVIPLAKRGSEIEPEPSYGY